jgi:glycosyltransferase involved in cell wall biosynthesis
MSTDTPPDASVVVACHGRREKTVACIESLLAQELETRGRARLSLEVLVVDDGSPDDTPDAVEALAPHAHAAGIALTVLRNGANLGANRSRNRGVAHARGVLVAFVDSDCVLAADWLRALVAPFEDPCVGAVSGLVEDTCRDNAWERMFAGTHRLPRRGPVGRIVIGNLCVRREILAAHLLDESRPTRRDAGGTRPDLSISARSDEEGLNIALRDAGWKVLAEPSARAEHVHPYTRRSLLRQAYFGGQSAAEIVWKYRLAPRKDLAPIALFHALLAGAAIACAWTGPWVFALPAAALLLPVAAISYNELRNKGKSPMELARAAPVLVLYYHWRLAGYALRRAQLALGVRAIARADRAALARALPRPPSRADARSVFGDRTRAESPEASR